jgi:hypothetical protein
MPPVDVVSKQTMHVLINGPDGANTLFITTGLAQVSLRTAAWPRALGRSGVAVSRTW